MAEPRGNKRARATFHRKPHRDPKAMTPAMRTKMLTEAAIRHPDVMASIIAWHDKKVARETPKTIDFDSLAEKAENIIRKATRQRKGISTR